MDYGIDFVGHEYQIRTDIQYRLSVFASQILDDIYVHVNTHESKVLALQYIYKTLDKLTQKDIIVSTNVDKHIMDMIRKITFKRIPHEYVRYKDNKIYLK